MRCMVSDVILLGCSTSVSSEVIFESIMDAENVNNILQLIYSNTLIESLTMSLTPLAPHLIPPSIIFTSLMMASAFSKTNHMHALFSPTSTHLHLTYNTL